MAYNEDSSASGHDEPWIQWCVQFLSLIWKLTSGPGFKSVEKKFVPSSVHHIVFAHTNFILSLEWFSFFFCYHRFCGLKGHEMFCEVERSYIEDGFNLYGLRTCVSNFSDCLDLILDRIGPDDSDDSHLTQSACTLYGLIHARYIITAHGLDAMYNKVSTQKQNHPWYI